MRRFANSCSYLVFFVNQIGAQALSSDDASHETAATDAAGEDQNKINKSRRYFLIGATSAVAGVGVVGAAIPFLSYWSPSAKARAMGAPVKIDFSKLAPGEMLSPIQAWRGKPIFVIYRDEKAVDALV